MNSDSESKDSDLDDFVELSDSNIFDDLDNSDSDTETPKKKKLKSPKKEDTIIIIESDSESSATDIVQQEFKTELNGDAVDYETSSDSADLVLPKRVRFKSGTKSGEQQSGTVRSDRPKAKTKQRRWSSDIRKYFTPEKAKKSKRSSGRSKSTIEDRPIRKIPCRRNVRGETPLHVASIRGDLDRVKLLIKDDHDVNAKDNNGWTPLHEAANRDHVEIVGYLLDHGANVDPQGGDDMETPLIDAASNGHIHTMKLLIEHGADCKLRDKKDQTALEVLRQWNKVENNEDIQFLRDYTKLLALLKTNMGLKAPSPTKPKSKKKPSPVKTKHNQAVNGTPHCPSIDDTDSVVIKSKSKKLSPQSKTVSPLEESPLPGSHAIDGTEIQADTDDTEEWGGEGEDVDLSPDSTPRKAVCYSEPHLDNKEGRSKSTIEDRPIRKIPCRRNVRGETPLHVASIRGDLDRVKLLIKDDHDVNAKDNNGWTPLHEAANRDHVEIVGYLLDHGANVDPQGGDDMETPLIDAASNGHIHTMKLLIEHGADCKLRDKKDQTALEVLRQWNKVENNEDIQFLRDYTKLLALLKTNMGLKAPSPTKPKSKKKPSPVKTKHNQAVNGTPHCPSIDDTDSVVIKSKSKKLSPQSKTVSPLEESPLPGSHAIDGTEIQADTDDTEEWGGEGEDVDLSPDSTPRKAVCYSEPHLDNKEVVLLITSKLCVTYEEYACVRCELGVSRDQCIVWPSLHLRDSIIEEHIPHIMMDVVERVRNGDLSKLTALLTSLNKEKYNFFVEQIKDGLDKNILYFNMVEDLAEINRNSARKVGLLLDKDTFKVLVIYLYSDIPTHRHLISSSLETLYRWNSTTSLRRMSEHSKRNEEYDKLFKWFQNKLVCSYHTDIYPTRQAVFPMEKILYSEQYSSSVTTNLESELTNLRRKFFPKSDSEILLLCIDGANRKIVQFKAFVKKAIEMFTVYDSMNKEIFFIVSVVKSDQIDTVSDLVPDSLIRKTSVFTAFNPEKVQSSCIIIHVKLDEDQSAARTLSPLPSTSSSNSAANT